MTTTGMVSCGEDRLAEIAARHEAATKGPWQWFGNTKFKRIYLSTIDRGRIYIMEFVRWGMGGACPTFQPPADGSQGWSMVRADARAKYESPYREDFGGIDHPDAIAIEHSWEDVDWLIREVNRLRLQVGGDDPL